MILIDANELKKEFPHDEDWDFQHEAALRYWKNRIRMITDRTYSENGKGGLFPLRKYSEDQRKVPIWYQFNAWLEENSDEDGGFLLRKNAVE